MQYIASIALAAIVGLTATTQGVTLKGLEAFRDCAVQNLTTDVVVRTWPEFKHEFFTYDLSVEQLLLNDTCARGNGTWRAEQVHDIVDGQRVRAPDHQRRHLVFCPTSLELPVNTTETNTTMPLMPLGQGDSCCWNTLGFVAKTYALRDEGPALWAYYSCKQDNTTPGL